MIFSGFGHKPNEIGGYDKGILAKLIAFAVETIPQFGPTKIISGMSLGWEQALAMAAIELDIPLVAALPFEGHEKVWPDKTQIFYQSLLKEAKEVRVITSGGYEAAKFFERDKWIVDKSEGIFIFWKNWKGEVEDILKPSELLNDDLFELIFSPVQKKRSSSSFLQRVVDYAGEKDRSVYQLWPLWEEFDNDVQYEGFRSSLMDMSLDEL
jgi:uncharacterized phage-like protein YoqJ